MDGSGRYHSVKVSRESGKMRMYRILRFNDEVKQGTRHTEEHFNQILEDITKYNRYCGEHKDFPNDKAVLAIKNIRDTYDKCMEENDFL